MIHYNGLYFLPTSDTTCKLMRGDDDYNGDLKIPSSIEIDGKTYSVTSIGSRAFRDCSGLTSIEIPSSVTSIGIDVFRGCCSLSSFNGKYASDDNRCLIVEGKLVSFAPSGLTSYQIPETVTAIGDGAFGDCEDLTSIEIPDSVTSIGECAFYECRALASIEIPSSVTSIGVYAFFCFGGLKYVTIHSLNPITELDREYPFQKAVLFDSSVSGCTLYVPKGSKSLYQQDPGWCKFGNIQEME